MSCVICTKAGKARKYFFKGNPLCDKDYIGYLEFLLDDSEEQVTTESAESAFAEYKLSLDPAPEPIKIEIEEEPEYVAPSPYRMRM